MQHAGVCPSCEGYLRDARRIGDVVKSFTPPLQGDDAGSAWTQVKAGMERGGRGVSPGILVDLWRWLTFHPRPIWVSAFTAVAVIALVSFNNIRFDGDRYTHPVVEYVESRSSQVMVLTPSESPVTVIWVFDDGESSGGYT